MVDVVGYLISLFLRWVGLFTAPVYHFEILWIIIPVWISWILTEIYQEKRRTSLGNAISNGVVPFWVGIDWGRTTYMMLKTGQIGINLALAVKLILIVSMIVYGLIIIIIGIKAMKITRYVGRIREVTYFALTLTPVFYGIVPLDMDTAIAILLFFPVFYGIIELIDRITPTPKTYEEEGVGAEMPGLGKEEMPQLPEMPQQPTTPQQPQYPRQGYPPGYPPQY